MPKIAYLTRRLSTKTRKVGDQANEIIAEYQAAGFTLTLRQLYYQFVARDLLPNSQKSHKKLGNVMNDARLAGLIDWEALEDRTRSLHRRSHFDGPGHVMQCAASSYALDLWNGQDQRVEVWIEKDALIGVIERVPSLPAAYRARCGVPVLLPDEEDCCLSFTSSNSPARAA